MDLNSLEPYNSYKLHEQKYVILGYFTAIDKMSKRLNGEILDHSDSLGFLSKWNQVFGLTHDILEKLNQVFPHIESLEALEIASDKADAEDEETHQ